MEKELNIAAILKDKPAGTKLWSPIFGNCVFSRLSGSGIRVFPIHNGFTSTEEKSFFATGQYTLAGEVCLFPSKQMQDWSKFAWKKGDVLVNSRGLKILFDRWANDNYTSFYAKTINLVEDAFLDTNLHTLASEKEAKSFIRCIEEKFGSKLNLETLEIEQPKQEFKDGDIVFVESSFIGIHTKSMIAIFNKDIDNCYEFYFELCNEDYDGATTLRILPIMLKETQVEYIRLATEEEKQQLFSALAKKGKAWDSKKKQIVDLKPKWITPKPFDRVITRGDNNDIWTANIFSHMNSYGEYVAIGCVGGYHYCLPYNDETKHLLGTTDEWKGGEG